MSCRLLGLPIGRPEGLRYIRRVSRAAWLWDRISEGYFRPVAAPPKTPHPAKWRDDRLTLAWLGHSTLLVNLYGLWLITDPALLMRVGVRAGVVTLGPKRLVAPALRTRQLPPLDFILLTHAHMDHFDLGTLRRLSRRATVITAKSTADLLPRRFRDVVELTWGESRTFHRPRGTLKVEAIRVRHWGARIRTDTHRGFNGYVVERNGRRLFLAGDTARTDMRSVGRKAPIDVMAVPIGAYDPWIMSHCSPEEAVAMANEARAQYVVPIHHQTFRLGREPMDEPIRRFRNALEPDRIALTEVGETFELPR
jgi:L-ascorbate metabolism protein UlaG (beta-lactamase superfamily)